MIPIEKIILVRLEKKTNTLRANSAMQKSASRGIEPTRDFSRRFSCEWFRARPLRHGRGCGSRVSPSGVSSNQGGGRAFFSGELQMTFLKKMQKLCLCRRKGRFWRFSLLWLSDFQKFEKFGKKFFSLTPSRFGGFSQQ